MPNVPNLMLVAGEVRSAQLRKTKGESIDQRLVKLGQAARSYKSRHFAFRREGSWWIVPAHPPYSPAARRKMPSKAAAIVWLAHHP